MTLMAEGVCAQEKTIVQCAPCDHIVIDTVCLADCDYDIVDTVYVGYDDEDEGLYGDKNDKQLMALYKKGDVNAGKYLAGRWTEGTKAEQMKGIKLLEKITKKGDAMDWYLLGLEYDNQEKHFYSETKALECMRKSADAGYWEAPVYMGDYYAQRVDVEGNAEIALDWYAKALEKEPAEVYEKIGDVYSDEKNPSKDYEKAVYAYHMAGEAGNEHGSLKEALCYRDGKGVEKDLQKAMNLIHEALNGDHRPWGEERADYLNAEGEIALELGLVEHATACWTEICTYFLNVDESPLNDYMEANAKEYVYENDFMVMHLDLNCDIRVLNDEEVDFKLDGYDFAVSAGHIKNKTADELMASFDEMVNKMVEEEHDAENVVVEVLDDMIVDGKNMTGRSLTVEANGFMVIMMGKLGDETVAGVMMSGMKKQPNHELLEKVVKSVRWK